MMIMDGAADRVTAAINRLFDSLDRIAVIVILCVKK